MDEHIQALIDKSLAEYTKYIDAGLIRRIVDVEAAVRIPKGRLIAGEGEAFFLLAGAIRGFYLDKDGCDVTHLFIFENQICGSDFLTTDKPQVCSYEALEDCAALAIDMEALRAIVPTDNRLLWFYVNMLERALKQKMVREMSLATKTATERYIDLTRQYPGIERRVSQAHIASYLSITPVSLSRIRRVIREEG